MASFQPQPSYRDEHEAFAASRSSEHVYVPIDDRSFSTLDKHAETIEMDAKLPLVGAVMFKKKIHSYVNCIKITVYPLNAEEPWCTILAKDRSLSGNLESERTRFYRTG